MSCFNGPRGLAILILLVLSVPLSLTRPLAAGQNDVRRINGEGNLLYGEGEWAEALELYTAAGELDPENPVLHYNLANTLYYLNDLEKAETHYRVAAASENEELARRARFNLGNTGFRRAEALEGAGDWPGRNKALVQSIGHWQSVLEEDPGNRDAKLNLELARRKLQEEPPENEQQQDQEDQQEQQQQDEQQDKQNQQPQQQDEQDAEEEQSGEEQQSESGEDEQPQEEPSSEQQEEQEQPAGEEQAEEMRISPEEAQRILDALRDEEIEEQRRQMAERKGRGGSAERDW